MIDVVETLMRKLPAPHGQNAGLAAVIGFLAGGIGLAIYFRNIVDFVFPVVIGLVLAAMLGDLGILAGCLLAALYGYFRVVVALEVAEEKARVKVG